MTVIDLLLRGVQRRFDEPWNLGLGWRRKYPTPRQIGADLTFSVEMTMEMLAHTGKRALTVAREQGRRQARALAPEATLAQVRTDASSDNYRNVRITFLYRSNA